jgi:Protein of unknown function (DUF3047)
MPPSGGIFLPARSQALSRTLKLLSLAAALVAGCASSPPPPAEAPPTGAVNAQGWQAVLLPGKEPTRYAWGDKDGRPALSAASERSASMWRRKVDVPASAVQEVSFSWWVEDLVPDASVAELDREDAPARVMLAFGGDSSKLPQRTRMMFELAEALSGEPPPYATLMYVWDSSAPVGSVIVNPRTDRIRKIVVDSGPENLRSWRDHRRDVIADFRLAFGENPGPLQAIAVMTDSDNTASRARAWYGPVAATEPLTPSR